MGRKNTYFIYFIVGAICYILIPQTKQLGSLTLFVCLCALILSFYGGGFSTIPAYLADIFGTRYVGAIHGRLLTAWSMAALFGPGMMAIIKEFQVTQKAQALVAAQHISLAEAEALVAPDAYNLTMYILAGVLIIGAIFNFLVKPVKEHYYMTEEELQKYDPLAGMGDH